MRKKKTCATHRLAYLFQHDRDILTKLLFSYIEKKYVNKHFIKNIMLLFHFLLTLSIEGNVFEILYPPHNIGRFHRVKKDLSHLKTVFIDVVVSKSFVQPYIWICLYYTRIPSCTKIKFNWIKRISIVISIPYVKKSAPDY